MAKDLKTTWDACGEAFDRFTSAEDSFSENVEWPALKRLLGDLCGLRALDLGCGSGTYAIRLAGRGAQVTALDLSPTMLRVVRDRPDSSGPLPDLLIADIASELPFSDARFDLVFTATVLHYVNDLAAVMVAIARVLKPGGRLIASVLHPISTARFGINVETWESRHAWPLHYFGSTERTIETPWLGYGDVPAEGRRIDCFHHTLSDYFTALKAAGLHLLDLCEPRPAAEFRLMNADRYEEAMNVPVYLVMTAIRSGEA